MKKTVSLLTVLCLILTILCGTAAAEGDEYRVQVVDVNGEPVPGVIVQFCSETQCMMGKTGADGFTAFDQGPGEYSIHILKVPEGFTKDESEYEVPATPDEPIILVIYPEGYGEEEVPEDEEVMDVSVLGFQFRTPESFRNAKGTIAWNGNWYTDELICADATYYAVEKDRFNEYVDFINQYIEAFMANEELPEPPVSSWLTGYEQGSILYYFAVKNGTGEEQVRKLAEENYLGGDFAWLEDMGTYGDARIFVGQQAASEESAEAYREGMGNFYDEYLSLLDKDTILSAFSFCAPEWPDSLGVGDVISFETTDLDGNPVSSADIFAQAKVTMINYWATWCGPCKRELPELAVMADTFAEQGCQVIGICDDGAELADLAKSLLEQAGVRYVNIAAPEGLKETLGITGIPISFFVDSEGRMLVEPVEGAMLDQYPLSVAAALELAG